MSPLHGMFILSRLHAHAGVGVSSGARKLGRYPISPQARFAGNDKLHLDNCGCAVCVMHLAAWGFRNSHWVGGWILPRISFPIPPPPPSLPRTHQPCRGTPLPLRIKLLYYWLPTEYYSVQVDWSSVTQSEAPKPLANLTPIFQELLQESTVL